MRHISALCIEEVRAQVEIGALALHNEADVAWRISDACRPAGGQPYMEETMAVQTATGRRDGMVCVCGLLVFAFTAVVGCASDKPKPMQQPSPEQVKGSADRTFDKLKQEERERKPAGQ
jgi:hypothetical protein